MPNLLILGQGLAGTLLAAELLRAGCSIRIADPGETSTSSRVAAGMIHPVTGRRIAKSWKVDEFLPAAVEIYKRQEIQLNQQFFHEVKSLELYKDTAHQNEWMAKSAEEGYRSYIGETCPPESVPQGIEKGNGGQWLIRGGWLDTIAYLDAWRKHFRKLGVLSEEKIEEEEIDFSGNYPRYRKEEFDFVVDCRGAASATGKWFGYLPFNMAKGEVLTIRCADLKLEGIMHKSVKLIPAAGDEFICGATFSWHQLDNVPTEKGKQELETKLRKLLLLPYFVTSHRAGIRPATKDRRPFLGQHPQLKQLYIFNGLGAKGVLLAPALAEGLCSHLLHQTALLPESDIRRTEKITDISGDDAIAVTK